MLEVLIRRRPALAGLMLSLLGPWLSGQGLYDETTLRPMKLRFPMTDWFSAVRATWQTENYVKADLIVDQRVYPNVGVRARGYSSAGIPKGSKKLPLRISMDVFQSGQRLLGYKTLKLNNGLWDPAMIREVLGYSLYRRYIPAPKANFVTLEVNGENIGVYQNVQSVDTVFTREAFGTSRGNRYEAFGHMRDWGALANYKRWFFLRSKDRGHDFGDLVTLCRIYGSPMLFLIEAELPKHLAIDHFYRHLAGCMLTGHTDSGITKDYYLYRDPYTGLFHSVPWDMNLAMRFPFLVARLGTHRVPLQVPAFNERFLAHLRTMVEEALDEKAIVTKALAYQGFIDRAVQADRHKFYTLAEFRSAVTQTVRGTPSIRSFVQKQLAVIKAMPGFNRSAPALTKPERKPVQPRPQDPIWFGVTVTGSIPATKVSVHVSAASRDLEFPMFDDGQHGDGKANDGRYGVTVPPPVAGADVRYYFAAYNGGTVRFLPRSAGYGAFGVRIPAARNGVLIHEFVADNESGIRDEKGQKEDWLELYNPTSGAIDVSGMWLSDRRRERHHWKIPGKTLLGPGQALLVWADEDLGDGPYHADFKLSKGGEELALYAADGLTLLDHVSFGPQAQDIGTGRLYDRVSPWVTYAKPTPRSGNEPLTCGVRVYSARKPWTHTRRMGSSGSPRVAGTVTVRVEGAPARSAVLVLFAASGDSLDLGPIGVSLLVSPWTLVAVPAHSDGSGKLSFAMPIPADPRLVGQTLALQGLSHDRLRWLASNGLAFRFCR